MAGQFNHNTGEPKYEAFSRFLLGQIQSGHFQPGSKLPAERDLARQYNIAHMTVNKALNGLVSAGYLERMPPRGTFVRNIPPLRSAVAVIDYRAVHALLPQPLQHAMADAGFVLTVFDIYQVVGNAELFLNYCMQQKPELLLIEGYSILPFELFEHLPPELPRLVFHRNEHELLPGAGYVLTDFKANGRLAAQALLRAGKSRIAVLLGIQDTPLHTDLTFAEGVKAELAERGLEPIAVLSVLEQTPERLRRLTDPDGADGVCAILDSYLVPLVKLMRERNRTIPEDMALVGHNNTPWAESYELTSIDIQPIELARRVRLQVEHPEESCEVLVPGRLIVRQSCP